MNTGPVDRSQSGGTGPSAYGTINLWNVVAGEDDTDVDNEVEESLENFNQS